MAHIITGDNPVIEKFITSKTEAILPTRLPSGLVLVALDKHIDEQPDFGREMARVRIEDIDVVRLWLEVL